MHDAAGVFIIQNGCDFPQLSHELSEMQRVVASYLSVLTYSNTGPQGSTFFPLQVNSCCCSYSSATVKTLFNVYKPAAMTENQKVIPHVLYVRESASPAVCVTFRISKVVQLQCVFCNRRGPQSHNTAPLPKLFPP